MSKLLNRKCRLTIVKPNGFFGAGSNAVIVENLQVKFDIEKHLEDTPNSSKISVFNMSQETRTYLAKKPLRVTLDTAYEGQEYQRIFVGDVRFIETKRHSVDWETVLQLGDGSRAFSQARIAKSYAPGTDLQTIVRDTASSMGLTIPSSAEEARALFKRLTGPINIHGQSEKQLTKVLKPQGLSWSIQDGKLQILASNQVRRDQAVVISEDTGMVGSPERGAPKDEGEPAVTTVRTLLEPRLTPGGRIKIISDVVSGFFRLTRVTHSGDTEGGEWYSTVEGTPL